MGTKVVKSSPSADTGLVVSENAVRLTSTEDNGITVGDKGTTIQGPISIVAGGESIRVGGLWTLNSTMTLSLPSTLATPSPVFNIDAPTKAFEGLVQEVVVMLELLGALI
jgi:hypothetical protein